MQTLRRRDTSISLDEYRRMIDLKTAELFRVSCFLGASLSGHSPDFARAADKFGHHLGIAYQIYDDLVDFLGEEQQIGKTLGTDLATGKLTLPLMLLLEKVTPAERAAIVQALHDGQSPGLAASRQRMQELGVVAGVFQAIEDELTHATGALDSYSTLVPVPLMRQLVAMLQGKVAALPATRDSR
jgi:octaprenyl-diphosphate synthase